MKHVIGLLYIILSTSLIFGTWLGLTAVFAMKLYLLLM
uniref:Uncharacterized protein n=1 Tax=Myoviridae sp. ctCo31 TaxID=2825053 RepID=A0A8S5UMT6_9CAUD|nr:MAG TPA: hypothetical protein [Myoviridae sp. ctCo31]